MRPIYFNGKFYARGLNGVHRVADRLIREVDGLLARTPEDSRPAATLLVPANRRITPELSTIRLQQDAGADSQRWEQFTLPRIAREGVLVNLCNLAPLAHRRKILMFHDAQFLLPDNGYTARQRIGYRLLTRRMASSSAQVLTISHYSQAMLDLLGVCPRARSSIIANGVDHILETEADAAIVQRLGIAPRRFVIMFGSPKGYKNVEVVFRAFAEPLDDLRLVVVGPSREALERVGLSPPADAVFAGSISDAELRGLYESALCIAFPSRTEGFGLPPLEALLCGCPAVVAPAGAIPEVCVDAVTYCDVDDARQWRDAFLLLASDAEGNARKIAAGRQRAGEFTWARAGSQLYAHILKLCAT
jgi:glycosyltransferase involved in cell wall biosynthesis